MPENAATDHTVTSGTALAHALEHRDERQRPLALAQVGAHRLAEALLVGDEVQRVVGDLEGDADVEAVARERLRLHGRGAAQQGADTTAGGDEGGQR